jgi:hypothetical protein
LDLVQGDYLQIRERLRAALKSALPLYRPPITLAILATAVELFTYEGDLAYATLLATFVRDHPASAARVKERVEKVLSDLDGQLSAEELATINHRSQGSDLYYLAEQLLTNLEPTI